MKNSKSSVSRSRFMVWGVGILASFTALRFFKPFAASAAGKAATPKTVKMLGQDGKLVEVDMTMLHGQKRKITNDELYNWIKK